MSEQQAARQYFLQDSRGLVGDNLMFWAKTGSYTSNINEAEVFDEDRAFRQNHCRDTDIPWPTDYIAERARRVVDMQYIKPAELAAYENCDAFYVRRMDDWVGNDILFATKGDKYTTNVADARVFSKAEAFTWILQHPSDGVLPKEYADAKSRPAVEAKQTKLKEALGEANAKLAKKERRRPETHRCHSCGIFLTAVNYYTAPCPRCDAENRP